MGQSTDSTPQKGDKHNAGARTDANTSLFNPHTIPHELKLSVWWNEADAPLRIKFAEPHALVESAVVNGD